MKYLSTKGRSPITSVADALFQGLAPDGGLFMPCEVPSFSHAFLDSLASLSFSEIAEQCLSPFFSPDIPNQELRGIIEDCFSFPASLVRLNESTLSLELFHGPTLAFKDFGARFLARTLGYLRRNANKPLTVLVATSGDTGGAVASGFYRVPGIQVVILYPSGKVSMLQEKQLTTLGENVTALEIQGTFDDCQALVKNAFLDKELTDTLELTSANSINIGRLLPQMTYYVSSFAKAREFGADVVYAVPSGNLGNLTAGVFAKRMGVPIHHFVLATNANDVAAHYLQTGEFIARPSVQTCSNAMDVGDPSNLIRLQHFYNGSLDKMRADITASSFNDQETKAAIQEVYKQTSYTLDPHGAVGFLAWKSFYNSLKEPQRSNTVGIVLETAHPAKFGDTVYEAIGQHIELPEALKNLAEKEKHSVPMGKDYSDLKDFLMTSKNRAL